MPEFGKTPTAQNQEETYADLIKYGMSPADILNFLDAVIRGDIRHINIGWLE